MTHDRIPDDDDGRIPEFSEIRRKGRIEGAKVDMALHDNGEITWRHPSLDLYQVRWATGRFSYETGETIEVAP